MEVKKVVVSTVSVRKFVENLIYLGSIGATFDDKCIAVKGLLLRAEVFVPVDEVVEETVEMKVAAGLPIKPEKTEESKQQGKKPAAKKAAKKVAKKSVSTPKQEQGEEVSLSDVPLGVPVDGETPVLGESEDN